MAAYGCFKTATGPQYPLLSLAPVMDEPNDQPNAEGHLTAIKRFLSFLFCHRLNLAVREYLESHDSVLEEVQQLMRKLRTLKQAAKLRAKTPMAAVPRQDTRWSSTFWMLKRYFRLREFISDDDEELSDFLPSRSAHRKLEALLASLQDVESVSKHLQGDGLMLLDARVLFDELLKSHPSFTKYLTTDADIVHSAVFELAVVKVLDDQAALLMDDEVAVLEPFKRTCCGDHVRGAGGDSSTSNLMERLSSVARAVLRHERHRLSAMMLEMILFLKINSSYWDVATVEQCLLNLPGQWCRDKGSTITTKNPPRDNNEDRSNYKSQKWDRLHPPRDDRRDEHDSSSATDDQKKTARQAFKKRMVRCKDAEAATMKRVLGDEEYLVLMHVAFNWVVIMPYFPDNGTIYNVIPRRIVKELLQVCPDVKVESLRKPIGIAVEGAISSCDESIQLVLDLISPAGKVRMRKMTCIITETEDDEFLLLSALANKKIVDFDPFESEIPVGLNPPDKKKIISRFWELVNDAVANGFPVERKRELFDVVMRYDIWCFAIGNDPPSKIEPFEQGKHLLASSTTVVSPGDADELILMTDASDAGWSITVAVVMDWDPSTSITEERHQLVHGMSEALPIITAATGLDYLLVERLKRDILRVMLLEYKVEQDNCVAGYSRSGRGLSWSINNDSIAKNPGRHDAIAENMVGIGEFLPDVREAVANLRASFDGMHQEVTAAKEKQTKRNKSNHRGARSVNFHVGDHVLVSRVDAKKQGNKLSVTWVGRYLVIGANVNSFEIEHSITPATKFAHALRLKMYADQRLGVSEEMLAHVANQDIYLTAETFTHHREHATNRYKILVRWEGLEALEDSWAPVVTMFEDVPIKLQDYVDGGNDDGSPQATQSPPRGKHAKHKTANRNQQLLVAAVAAPRKRRVYNGLQALVVGLKYEGLLGGRCSGSLGQATSNRHFAWSKEKLTESTVICAAEAALNISPPSTDSQAR
ncbi:hypothetical protein ON010_g4978 [Phytophthora cinnamomi]|nr:hypothetical protein ON010_g4978 [Phytophthora cinnamomi]